MTFTTDHPVTMGDEDESQVPASSRHDGPTACQDHPAPRQAPAAESDIPAPLIRAGTDPGYIIANDVATQGMPRGANWMSASSDGVLLCVNHWGEVQRLCGTCFGAFGGAHVIDHRDTDEWCRMVLARVGDIIRTYPQQCAFGGCRKTSYPWQLSTDTSQGPTTIEYTVSHSIEKSESVTEGWSVGGSAGFTLGPFGGSVSREYSESRTNTTAWSKSGSTASTGTVESSDWGRIDVFATAGLYDGYLYFSIKNFEGHAGGASGNHCFILNGHHFWTTSDYLCFPLRGVMIKSPGLTLPADPRAPHVGQRHPGAAHHHVRRRPKRGGARAAGLTVRGPGRCCPGPQPTRPEPMRAALAVAKPGLMTVLMSRSRSSNGRERALHRVQRQPLDVAPAVAEGLGQGVELRRQADLAHQPVVGVHGDPEGQVAQQPDRVLRDRRRRAGLHVRGRAHLQRDPAVPT